MSELRTLVNSAYETAKKGYYRDALDEFELILAHSPDNARALYGASACAYRLGLHPEADRFVDRLLRKDPGNKQAQSLKKKIVSGDFAESVEPTRPDPLTDETPVEDPFGLGSDPKSLEVIEEWQTIDVHEPTASELIRDGKVERTGKLRILGAYRKAWREYRLHFKTLVLAGWLALFIKVGIATFFVTVLAGVVRQLSGFAFFAFLIWPYSILLGFIAFFVVYPLFGMHAYFCHRLKYKWDVKVKDEFLFLEKYPNILVTIPWVFAPLYLFPLAMFVFRHFWILDLIQWGLGPKVYPYFNDVFFWLGYVVQVVFFVRCWFVNLVVIDSDLPPLTAVSRAYHLTRGQTLRVFVFALLQTLLLPIALLPLGIGYPFVAMAQVEAFEQIDVRDTGKVRETG